MKREVIHVQNISKALNNKQIIEHLDLRIYEGEWHVILGLSGSGKTTLGNILQGDVLMDSGVITVGEYRIRNPKKEIMRSEGIHVIGQETTLINDLSIADNLTIFNRGKNLMSLYKKEENKEYADTVLRQYGLENLSSEIKINQLNTGMKDILQVIQLAEQKVKLLIFDGTFTAYNLENIKMMMKILFILRQRGVAILILSQQIKNFVLYSDQVHLMKQKTLIMTLYGKDIKIENIRRFFYDNQKEIDDKKRMTMSQSIISLKFLEGPGSGFEVSVSEGEIVSIVDQYSLGLIEYIQEFLEGVNQNRIHMRYFGENFYPTSIQKLHKEGIGYIPRHSAEGLMFDEMPIYENIGFQIFKKMYNRLGIIKQSNKGFFCDLLDQILENDHCRSKDLMKNCDNGLKSLMVYYRWHFANTYLLICSIPFESVDELMKYRIIEIIKQIAAEGSGVLILNNDFEGMEDLCNRILTFRDKKLVNLN